MSLILANLVMEYFEQNSLESYPDTSPRLWLHYVDDSLVIINRTEQNMRISLCTLIT